MGGPRGRRCGRAAGDQGDADPRRRRGVRPAGGAHRAAGGRRHRRPAHPVVRARGAAGPGRRRLAHRARPDRAGSARRRAGAGCDARPDHRRLGSRRRTGAVHPRDRAGRRARPGRAARRARRRGHPRAVAGARPRARRRGSGLRGGVPAGGAGRARRPRAHPRQRTAGALRRTCRCAHGPQQAEPVAGAERCARDGGARGVPGLGRLRRGGCRRLARARRGDRQRPRRTRGATPRPWPRCAPRTSSSRSPPPIRSASRASCAATTSCGRRSASPRVRGRATASAPARSGSMPAARCAARWSGSRGITEVAFVPLDARAADAAMLSARPIAEVAPRSA